MKVHEITIVLIIVLLIAFVVLITNKTVSTKFKDNTIIIDSLTNVINYKDSIINHRDSLYYDHISNCMYISKEMFDIDSRGYIKLKDERRLNINN